MVSLPLWLYIGLVLFSGFFGVIVTLVTQAADQSKRDRYEVFMHFMQYRYDLNGERFTETLNKIYVCFRKDKKVIDPLNSFLDGITYEKPGHEEMNRRLIKIYSTMCTNLNIKNLEEHIFLRPFNAKKNS